MTLSNQIDAAEARASLTTWLTTKLAGAEDVEVANVAVSKSSGLSTVTLFFDACWSERGERFTEALVARIEPRSEGLFISYDLERESRLMSALQQGTSVPVPRIWAYEPDPAIIGAPFLVMQRLHGLVPQDDPPFTASGWVHRLEPRARRRLVDNALAAMVAVHEADWRALGLDAVLGAGADDPVADRIAYWDRAYAWAADGEVNPTVELALSWLRDHQPASHGAPVLSWGDARIGNMVFADDLSVAGILDWEIASIGPREIDVGWWLFMQRHHTDAINVPLPDGMLDRIATVARYETLSGCALADVQYYETLAALGGAITSHRLGALMIKAGLLPPDAPVKHSNPASHVLAGLIGVPAPDGSSQTYIGMR